MSRFPGREDLVSRYAAAGFDVQDLQWYVAFAEWKLAVVLQQLFRRFEVGQTQDERFARMGESVDRLIETARASLPS